MESKDLGTVNPAVVLGRVVEEMTVIKRKISERLESELHNLASNSIKARIDEEFNAVKVARADIFGRLSTQYWLRMNANRIELKMEDAGVKYAWDMEAKINYQIPS